MPLMPSVFQFLQETSWRSHASVKPTPRGEPKPIHYSVPPLKPTQPPPETHEAEAESVALLHPMWNQTSFKKLSKLEI